jgi:adenylate cyclase
MTLVERFIEFDRWPVSRKTAVLSGFLFVVHLVTDVVSEITNAYAGPTVMDIAMLRWVVMWPIVGALGIAFLVSYAVDRQRKEGRWTAVLLIVPYMLFLVALSYVFGHVSSPFIAALFVSGLVVVMIFGLRIGTLAVFSGLLLTLGTLVAQFQGRVPYAPILIDRTIDAQGGGWYMGIAAFVIFMSFAAAFAILILLVAAKQLQEARLEQTTRMIRRYVPSQLAEKIIHGEHLPDAKPERAKLTMFFSDIEGFTEAKPQIISILRTLRLCLTSILQR